MHLILSPDLSVFPSFLLKLEEEKQTKDTEQEKSYCGTEFLVVGVSSGASDVSGKLQIVQQQVDLNEWPELNSVTTAIGDMEK